MVGEETCVSTQGVGGNGIASEFGDLTGMTRQEVDDFLRGLGAKVKSSSGNYVEYKFSITIFVFHFIFYILLTIFKKKNSYTII